MLLSCYVYNRVALGRHASAHGSAAALSERIARETEVHGRLPTCSRETDLFMEVYRSVPADEGSPVAPERGARELDLAEVRVPRAARKLECFERACA